MTEGSVRDQSLARAEEGADRLHRTLEQLLLLARVEGSLSFDDGAQCSAEQVAKLAIQDAAGGERQRIKLHLPAAPSDAPLQMPAVLSIAALRNLLDNALRHTPADGAVELSLETIGNRARFVVRDHGPGIAPDDLQHLTQRFWRNGQSTGCGLGLAIVQAIVQRCACTLHFDSRPDGLRVELNMPLQPL
jgi:signal transduction histidine kinase